MNRMVSVPEILAATRWFSSHWPLLDRLGCFPIRGRRQPARNQVRSSPAHSAQSLSSFVVPSLHGFGRIDRTVFPDEFII